MVIDGSCEIDLLCTVEFVPGVNTHCMRKDSECVFKKIADSCIMCKMVKIICWQNIFASLCLPRTFSNFSGDDLTWKLPRPWLPGFHQIPYIFPRNRNPLRPWCKALPRLRPATCDFLWTVGSLGRRRRYATRCHKSRHNYCNSSEPQWVSMSLKCMEEGPSNPSHLISKWK